MNTYKRHRFPPDIISYAVWLYYRFNLSHRDIEDLLAERGITVSREDIRLWCNKFGSLYARRLKPRHQGYGDTFYIDEVFAVTTRPACRTIQINGKQHYLCAQWIKMAKWWMSISSQSAMASPPSASSSADCADTAVNPGRSLRVNCAATRSHIESLCQMSFIALSNMKIIVQSNHTRIPG